MSLRLIIPSACLEMPVVEGEGAVVRFSSSSLNTLCRFSICSFVSPAWWLNIFLTSADFAAFSRTPSAASESASIVSAVRSW